MLCYYNSACVVECGISLGFVVLIADCHPVTNVTYHTAIVENCVLCEENLPVLCYGVWYQSGFCSSDC